VEGRWPRMLAGRSGTRQGGMGARGHCHHRPSMSARRRRGLARRPGHTGAAETPEHQVSEKGDHCLLLGLTAAEPVSDARRRRKRTSASKAAGESSTACCCCLDGSARAVTGTGRSVTLHGSVSIRPSVERIKIQGASPRQKTRQTRPTCPAYGLVSAITRSVLPRNAT
jgi:hypothetical protein